VRWESSELPLPEEVGAPLPTLTSPARVPEPAAGKRPVRVWTQDESRFGLMTILRRRLTLKSVKPKVVAQHEYANSYLYGAVAPLSGESFFLELPGLNSELFGLFLTHLSAAAPDCLNILVLDNGSFHHAAKLPVPANIRLVFTPPYTPEVNPIERLWEDLKGRLAGLTFGSLEALSDKLSELIRNYTPEQLSSLTAYPFFVEACNALCSV
jgi:transposase